MTTKRGREATAWDSEVYRALQKRFRHRRRMRRLFVCLGLVACWLIFANSYPRLVELSDCEWEDDIRNGPGYIHISGGWRDEWESVAIFTSTGAIFRPWFYLIAFAPPSKVFVAIRRSRWGGEFRLLSVDLRSLSDGEVYRQHLGRVDEACWRTIGQYIEEVWDTPSLEVIDEGMGAGK